MNSSSHIQNRVSSALATSSGGSCLYALGGGLTVLYLLLMVLYVWPRWSEFLALAPNEAGDFLAGAFAPLAFAWLVLGFMQQGIELRQNSDALRLQVEELRTAAEHAGSMVELQRAEIELRLKELEEARQAEKEAKAAAQELEQQRKKQQEWKRAQPNFRFELKEAKAKLAPSANGYMCHWTAVLINEGALCTEVRVRASSDEAVNLRVGQDKEWDRFEPFLQQPVRLGVEGQKHYRMGKLSIDFIDALGNSGSQEFTVCISDSHFLELLKVVDT